MKPNLIHTSTLLKAFPSPSVQVAGQRRQAGSFAVEFALVLLVFLTMVCGIIEVSRMLYMWNTLQEVTRIAARAAATTNFKDTAAMDKVRREAIFRSTAGTLAFGDPITDRHILIDHMALTNQGSTTTQTPISDASLPGCPVRNRILCTSDSDNASCIRFIRVRVCEPDSNCTPVRYKIAMPLIYFPAINLPMATTIVRVQSLGYTPGMAICQ